MTRATDTNDDGFGLVEVLVAIFILGLLAVAMLPLLITGLRVAAEQSTVATATQLVSDTIEVARATNPMACDVLGTDRTTTDGRGVELHVVGVVVGSCAALGEEPGTIKYRVTVSSTSPARELATATTLIFAPGADD